MGSTMDHGGGTIPRTCKTCKTCKTCTPACPRPLWRASWNTETLSILFQGGSLHKTRPFGACMSEAAP